MELEFLLQNTDPTHLYLKGRHQTTVSSASVDSLVGCWWFKGRTESHSSQVT